MIIKYLYIASEMGPGWNATVFIRNNLEDDFIRDAQRDFGDLRNYFIGGKTSRTPGEVFGYHSYSSIEYSRRLYSENYDGMYIPLEFSLTH